MSFDNADTTNTNKLWSFINTLISLFFSHKPEWLSKFKKTSSRLFYKVILKFIVYLLQYNKA